MEPIAIIGMGCRFPGAPNPRVFWQMMCNGVDAIKEVPADRYDINAIYDPRPATPGKVMSRFGGFLEQVDQFDATFFGISPREAAKIDPQHRLLLEVAWEAMEDAGLVPLSMTEEEKLNIGCFIGVITGDYWDRQFRNAADLDVYATAGSARSGAAGRISFSQGLMGTSFAIDAACSSSLVGVDQAVQNLRSGACTMAVAGGVNIILNPDHTIGFSQGKMMAADGHCKSYDAAADGYVRSEGAGVVILKLLSQAQADGDRIHAIIPGCASNNDGHCDSFMAPSTKGQQAGLRKACQNANIDPLSINYVEAHGPGTKAGDPIEITTLGEVLCKNRSIEHPLLVGSVKTNIGHTEGAAGVAGLIKAVLSLKHKAIPPNLHFHEPNPAIPWQDYALTIPTKLVPWPQQHTDPRRAVVCSYGIAGTNTYVVVEEAPLPQVQQASTVTDEAASIHLLPLSARTPEALESLAKQYIAHLDDKQYQEQKLHDICYTASLRRTHHEHRLAIISNSREDAHNKLKAFVRGETSLEIISGCKIPEKQHKIAWIFPGQGSQWLGMGRDLLEQEPAFRTAIEECDQVISRFVDWSLLEQLRASEAHSRLNEIDVIQPTLFAIEVALAALWRSWGVEPDVVVGHSMGEVAAAYVAGALSLDDAAWIICSRSKLLLRASGKGAMAAVELSLDQAKAVVSHYQDRVSVAVSNSPNSTVLSGDPKALTEILTILEKHGFFGRPIKVDVASHSPQMDPLRNELLRQMEHVQPHQAAVPMFSTVHGTYIDGSDLKNQYWVDNLRQPVLFLTATQMLLENGFNIFMEMSPHPILIGAIRQTIEQCEKPGLALASMRRDEQGRSTMLATLGTLYTLGHELNWSGLHLAQKGQHVSLPTYPWQRQRHWNSSIDRHQSVCTVTTLSRDGKVPHPILNVSTQSALHPNIYFWTTEINTEIFPFLSEHCVHGMAVLPGAAYIELSLAAATEILGPQHFSIKDLVLKKALFFPQGAMQTLQVVLTPEAEAGMITLQFFSKQVGQDKQDALWTHHATAIVQRSEELLTIEKALYPLPEQVSSKWTLAMGADVFYQGLRARGVQHGPLFQGITHVWRHSNEVMAQIVIPQKVEDEMFGYQIHPALIDSILQGIIPLLPEENEEDTYVPVAVKQVMFYQRPASGSKLWTHAIVRQSNQGTLEGDITLLDEQGQILLKVLGFRLQSLDSDTQDLMRQRLKQLLYTIKFEPQAYIEQSQKKTLYKDWLIFSEHNGLGQRLAEHLRASGVNCVIVTPGQSYRQLRVQQYELPPASPEGFQLLLDEYYSENREQVGIVYLWGLLTTPVNETTLHTLHMDQDLASIGALHLTQAIAATKKEISPRLWLVTSGVHTIEGQDKTTVLSQATLWGLGRVIVYEHHDLHCTLVDIDTDSSSEECSTVLFREVWSNDEADEVALRGDRRYVARLARQALPDEQEQEKALFHSDGTYLITGGLGGVGLRTMQWMVEEGAQHIVLMGRSGASEEALAILKAMREKGVGVYLMRVDVAQEQQLANALNEIRRKLPPLRGIFHSAVVLDDSILLQQNRKRFLSVMPPKIDGAWNLHSLTLDDSLDYFVLFSSAASLIGSPGQSNYAAANAFIDILAYYRRQQGYPALSINWGRWGEVGQAMKENRGERLDVRGFASMKPKEGLAILGSLLRQSLPQVGVMSLNLSKWSQFYPKLTRSSLFTHLLKEVGTQEEHNRASGLRLTPQMLAELDDDQRTQALAQYLSSQIAGILGHVSLKLDAHQKLNRLGIDSLMSVELKNRIGSDLNVAIPVATLLQGVTFEQLIMQVAEQIQQTYSTQKRASQPALSLIGNGHLR